MIPVTSFLSYGLILLATHSFLPSRSLSYALPAATPTFLSTLARDNGTNSTISAACVGGTYQSCFHDVKCIDSFPESCHCGNKARRRCAHACALETSPQYQNCTDPGVMPLGGYSSALDLDMGDDSLRGSPVLRYHHDQKDHKDCSYYGYHKVDEESDGPGAEESL